MNFSHARNASRRSAITHGATSAMEATEATEAMEAAGATEAMEATGAMEAMEATGAMEAMEATGATRMVKIKSDDYLPLMKEIKFNSPVFR